MTRQGPIISLVLAIVGFLLIISVALDERAELPSEAGTVVDGSSRKSVAGAIVIAVREIEERQIWNIEGFSRDRCVVVDGAITDDEGRFTLSKRRVSIPEGWDFDSARTQFYVVAEGYRPVSVGDNSRWRPDGRKFDQPLLPGEEPEIALQPFGDGLLVSPQLDVLLHCVASNADLAPALPAFQSLFARVDLDTPDFHQRKWLNMVGRAAVVARFPEISLAETPSELTNEQIRDLLVGEPGYAKAQVQLRKSIIANNLEQVRELLESRVDPNVDDGYRRSRRWLALEHGAHGIYQLLRNHGARWRDGEAETMLYLLAERGDVEGVRLLVEEGVRADRPVAGGRFVAFIEAARKGHVEILRMMLENGRVADIDAKLGEYRGNALQLAFQRKHLDVFRLLLEHGANPDVADENGGTLLAKATPTFVLYADLLVEYGARQALDSRGYSVFTRAIQDGNRALADNMLAAGFSPGAGRTPPLAAAAAKGWRDMVENMLQHPDSRPGSEAWWHALWATATRDQGTFNLLLASYDGALSEPPSRFSCITCAVAAQGKTGVLGDLLGRGYPVDARDNDGNTPLMLAARHGKVKTVAVLLERGANANLINSAGTSALGYASDGGAIEFAERMAMGGSSLSRPTRTTVEMPPVKETVIEPVDITDRPSHEPPPKPITIKMQRAPEPTIGAVQMRVPHPMLKSIAGHPQVVQQLITTGAEVNIADNNGWTPLMRAAARGQEEIVGLLLKHGADPTHRNVDGKTASDLADEAGHHTVMELLEE